MLNTLDYERIVLSSIIFDPKHRKNLFSSLRKNDFLSIPHQDIFQVCFDLEKNQLPIEDSFIKSALEKINKWDEIAFISVLSAVPTENIDAYKKVVIDHAREREYRLALSLILDKTKALPIEEINAQVAELSEKYTSNQEILTNEFNFEDLENIEEEEATFYIKDFMPIQKNEVNLFSGKGGSGKSFLNLLLLAKLQKEKLKCFGFFSEDSKGITKKRCNTLANNGVHDIDFVGVVIAGKDTKKESFVMRDKTTGLPTESPYFARFKRAVKDFDIILIDPLIAFYGLDENSNGEIRFFMDLLNRFCSTENKTILLIHHHSKQGASRGASAIVDAVRMHYEISFEQDEEGVIINSHQRLSKLVKNNHWRGKTDFTFRLFSDEDTREKSFSEKKVLGLDAIDDDFEKYNSALDITIEDDEFHGDFEELKKAGVIFE